LAMAENDTPIPAKSKANKFDIRSRATKELSRHSFGLRRAAKTLVRGVQQQQEIAEFDLGVAQRTLTQVLYIVRIILDL